MPLLPTLWVAAYAAAAAPPAHLSFDSARAYVRANHPAVLAALSGVRASEARARARPWPDDPMVGGGIFQLPLNHLETPLMPHLSGRERATAFLMGPDMLPAMVMVSQTFPWPGRKWAEWQEATARTSVERAQGAMVKADLDRALAYAFADAGIAGRALEVLHSVAAVLDSAVTLSAGRAASGAGRQAEAIGAQADRMALQRDQVDVTQQLNVAQARLAALLGYAGPLQVPVIRSRVLFNRLPDRAALVQSALQHRPDLLLARAEVDVAGARTQRARHQLLPDVTASLSYMANVGGLGMTMEHGAQAALLGPPDMVTATVSVPLPVFAPLKQMQDAEAGSHDQRRARRSLEALERVALSEVDEALAGVTHAQGHLSLHSGSLIPLAERTLALAQAAYENGQGDLLGWLQAARALRSHQLEHLQAEAEYARHLADLERATGLSLLAFALEAAPAGPAPEVSDER